MEQGRVKWFNAKAGYGFVTSLKTNKDVFVHHSELKVGKEQFRYLLEGEYLEMEVTETEGKSTGKSVRGIGGGKLMCETRTESASASTSSERKETKPLEKKYKPRSAL